MNYSFLAGSVFIFLISTFALKGQDSIPCNSDRFDDALLEKLIGSWNVKGKVGGEPVIYHFSAAWVLDHQFIELVFADTAKKPVYTAKVLIGMNCVDKKYVAHCWTILGESSRRLWVMEKEPAKTLNFVSTTRRDLFRILSFIMIRPVPGSFTPQAKMTKASGLPLVIFS